jgi:hypothetical protein
VSDNGVPAEPRLASINRQQFILRSIDVERLIEEEHSARLIWQLIGRLDLETRGPDGSFTGFLGALPCFSSRCTVTAHTDVLDHFLRV